MKRLLFLALCSFGLLASAADMGLEIGFRTQSGTWNNSAGSTSSKNGFQVGGSGVFEWTGPWHIRSGLFYTQRPIEIKLDSPLSGSADVIYTHFDVPGQIMYKFEDYGGVFFGPMLSLYLDGKCTGSGLLSGSACKIQNEKSIILPIQLGATFKFAPQMGATIFYEMISGELSKDISNFRAVGLNLLISFD